MENTKPVIINREKTIIIEASEKHSNSMGKASYETTLNTPVEINNGDIISLSKAFVDTSKIDPDKVFLPDAVNVTWNNGLYLINQQIETVIPADRLTSGDIITDNKPIVFCQNHVEADGEMVLWTQVTTERIAPWFIGRTWAGVTLRFQIKDANGNLQTVSRDVPEFGPDPFADEGVEHQWDLNIVGQLSYPPKTWDEEARDWITSGTKFSDLFDVHQNGILRPITSVGTEYVAIDSGFFTPVINNGQFTIPAGSYEPTHLAKLITDSFSTMNSTRLTIDPVAKQNLYPYDISGFTYQTETLIKIPGIAFQQLPFSWSLSCLKGWTASVTYITENTPLTYTNFISTVVDSNTGDTSSTFRIYPALPLEEFASAAYPAGGGARVVLTPPEGYYDEGSAFLQYTENYNQTGADGKPMFAFVDCSPEHRNVFTYPLTGTFSWFGTNNVELVWDIDQKRFRFNYLHFPLTDSTSAPAVINQVTYNNNGTAYERNYDSPCLSTNITTASYGGIFFTSLEPQSSFWQQILGFSGDMIVSTPQGTTKKSYNNGYPTSAGAATSFTDVTLPEINLEYGKHVTEQLVVMGDITGQPKNYTGAGQTIFSPSATPADLGAGGSGRVAVEETNVRGITADNSTIIGLQTSGFYIVNIDIGTTYNENIGSDRNQRGYSRNIRGVIDRYYSANSYTSSQGGDIQYIHYGNSMPVSKIKVRFKNSDGTEIKNIGTDNTIFLKITKNNQVNISPDPVIPET